MEQESEVEVDYSEAKGMGCATDPFCRRKLGSPECDNRAKLKHCRPDTLPVMAVSIAIMRMDRK